MKTSLKKIGPSLILDSEFNKDLGATTLKRMCPYFYSLNFFQNLRKEDPETSSG
jgi:hypothetical protein